MPQISIIVPIYKVEKYLERCINSILTQTFTDFELILVNDGSPDRCGEICDEFSSRDSRVVVVHKENGGVSDARNVGVKKATGKYISFVDPDDFIHVDMLAVLYNNMIDSSSEISICNFQVLHNENECSPKLQTQLIKLSNMEAIHGFFSEDSVKHIVLWNKLYHRDLFDDISFPKNRLHEDEAVSYKLFYKSKYVVYSNATLYFYVKRTGSITESISTKNYLDTIEAFSEACDFFIEKNLETLSTKAIINLFTYLKDSFHNTKKNDRKQLKILHQVYRKSLIKYWSYLGQGRQRIWSIFYFISPKLHDIVFNMRDKSLMQRKV